MYRALVPNPSPSLELPSSGADWCLAYIFEAWAYVHLRKVTGTKRILNLVGVYFQTILESFLAGWGFCLWKVLPWRKRERPCLEVISQGHSISGHDKEDLSRTTGDSVPRQAHFAYECLTFVSGSLEGMICWHGKAGQSGAAYEVAWGKRRYKRDPDQDLPPGPLPWGCCVPWGTSLPLSGSLAASLSNEKGECQGFKCSLPFSSIPPTSFFLC